jgi:AraC-like DNA-binding protein
MALALLLEYYADQRKQRGFLDRHEKAMERLRPLFHLLDSHFSEPVTLGQAASVVGMSKPHFVRFFRQTTGLSFAAYLRRFRISKAQSLLMLTDKPISEISQELGFCDQSHFGVVFRKFAQCSPLQYRRHGGRYQDWTISP